VALDAVGHVFLTGGFSAPASFGGLTLPTPGNGTAVFVTKYDSTGNYLAGLSFGSQPNLNQGTALAVDPGGPLIVAGNYYASITIPNLPSLPSTGSKPSAFFASFDPGLGSATWAVALDGPSGAHYAQQVVVDANHDVYASATFSGAITWSALPAANATSAGAQDLLLLKLSASGTLVWSARFGDAEGQAFGTNGVALDASGNVVVAGQFSSASASSFSFNTIGGSCPPSRTRTPPTPCRSSRSSARTGAACGRARSAWPAWLR
jgi:hypothetical protein